MTEEEFTELENQFKFRTTMKFRSNMHLHDIVRGVGICITRGFYSTSSPSCYEITSERPPELFSSEDFKTIEKNNVRIIWNKDFTLSFRDKNDFALAMLLR